MLLSSRLLRFKRKSPVLYNCRCIICGDSEKSKTKARGYIYQRSGNFFYSCHNCGYNASFPKFLKEVDKGLYETYLFDFRLESQGLEKSSKPIPKRLDNNPLKELKCIYDLETTHPARKYVVSRKIPDHFYRSIYYCSRFKSWTNSQIQHKFESVDRDEERLVFPFFDISNCMFAYQGRTLDPLNKLRYITIILDETQPKMWGLDRVDFSRPYYVLEGPIDACFVKNAIATAGGKITSELMKIKANIDNAIVVYDNQPRNKDVVSNLWNAVRANYQCIIWPENLEYKDINDMVLAGIDVESLLEERTFQGLNAEQEFNHWKKVSTQQNLGLLERIPINQFGI